MQDTHYKRGLLRALCILPLCLSLGACTGNPETEGGQVCRPLAVSSLFSDAQAGALAKELRRSLTQQQHNAVNSAATASAAGYVFRNMLQQDTARLEREKIHFFRYLRTTAPFAEQVPGCAVYLLDFELIGEGDSRTFVLFAHPQGGTYYAFHQLGAMTWRLSQQGKFNDRSLIPSLDSVLTRANRCSSTSYHDKYAMLLARFTLHEQWTALAAADRCDKSSKTMDALLYTIYVDR